MIDQERMRAEQIAAKLLPPGTKLSAIRVSGLRDHIIDELLPILRWERELVREIECLKDELRHSQPTPGPSLPAWASRKKGDLPCTPRSR